MTPAVATKSDLWAALLRVQKALQPVIRTADNPFFKSKYAPLEDILAEVTPLLSEEGLVLTQPMEYHDKAGWVVVSRITHPDTGEMVESIFPIPPTTDRYVKDTNTVVTETTTPQGYGAGATYGRRIGLNALLSVSTPGEDDDGNATAQGTSHAKEAQAPPRPQSGEAPRASEKQVAFIGRLQRSKLDIATDGARHLWLSTFLGKQVKSTKSLTIPDAKRVIDHLLGLPDYEGTREAPLSDEPPTPGDDGLPF